MDRLSYIPALFLVVALISGCVSDGGSNVVPDQEGAAAPNELDTYVAYATEVSCYTIGNTTGQTAAEIAEYVNAISERYGYDKSDLNTLAAKYNKTPEFKEGLINGMTQQCPELVGIAEQMMD